MLRRAMRLLRMETSGPELFWLNRDLAIGGARGAEDWPVIYDAGVRGVIDIGLSAASRDAAVREHGMRYLNLTTEANSVPSPAELHIVSAWALERIAAGGRVLIQDSNRRFNDGLVGAATLIKSGLPAYLALLALLRARPDNGLDYDQSGVLVRFAAEQPVDSAELTAEA